MGADVFLFSSTPAGDSHDQIIWHHLIVRALVEESGYSNHRERNVSIVSLVNPISWSGFEIGATRSWNISQTVFCDSGCNPKHIEFIPN